MKRMSWYGLALVLALGGNPVAGQDRLPEENRTRNSPANHLIEPVLEEREQEIIEEEASSEVERRERVWVRGEYLKWWIRDYDLPILLTSGFTTDPRPGALDQPGTKGLFGAPNEESRDRTGGRFFGGMWLGESKTLGLEAGYLFLASRNSEFTAVSPGSPVLARPFFDVNANQQNSSLITFPGLSSGSVAVAASSFLQGAEANLLALKFQRTFWTLQCLAGFRFLNLGEDLTINENIQVNPAAFRFAGQNIIIEDHFETQNYFYGAQAGVRSELRYLRLKLDVTGKIAIGSTHEVYDIGGFTRIGGQAFNGGLLALPTNSGKRSRDVFAFVPEVDVNLTFQVTERLSAMVGYSFLYWSRVARPGDVIDLGVNVNQGPTSTSFGNPGGTARPSFTFNDTYFWAQGINLGMEFRY